MTREAIRKRLRRIEGQVRGLQRMVDDDRYCIDILEQISAATRALQSVALQLLEAHMGHCVAEAVRAAVTRRQNKLSEASAAIGTPGPFVSPGPLTFRPESVR